MNEGAAPIEMEPTQNVGLAQPAPTTAVQSSGGQPQSMASGPNQQGFGTGAAPMNAPGAQGLYIGPTGATTAPSGTGGYGGNKYRSDAAVEEDYEPLRRWNLIFGILHLVEAVAILILGAILARGPVPMNTAMSGFSSAGYVNELQSRGFFHPGGYICIIFFISALAHFIQYGTFRSWVNNTDKYRANRWRWFEYSISWGWMFYLVAMAIGMHEILLSLSLMGLVSCQMYLQLSMDLANGNISSRGRTEWLPHVFAWVPFVYVLVFVFSYQYGYPFRGVAPGVTYAISMIALFFLLFLLLIQLGYFVKSIRSYVAYEKAFVVINFVAKSVVGWLLFALFVYVFYNTDNGDNAAPSTAPA